jgi:hypothetical protein
VDLQLAIRVLWRFRLLVIPGLVLAATLAFLSMVRVNVSGSPHFSYRAQPQYESTTSVFVTTHGFPWGSLNLHAGPNDPNAPRYLTLATSGPVMKRLAQTGPINGVITAYPILAPDSTTLPLLGLSAVAATPEGAMTLARRHLVAFQTWLKTSQVKAGTDPDQRIVLEPVTGPLPATLLMGRKKTKPIMIFLAMSVAVIGLAFVLENLRPRIRTVPEAQPAEHQLADAQSTTRLTA